MKASCLCGDVTWSAEGPVELMHHCHCSICRKFHGSAFSTVGAVPKESFRMESGADKLRRYETSPGFFRCFCARCGSPAGGEPGDGPFFISMASFEGDPGARSLAHIYAASAAPWYEIADDLPQFDELPPGYDASSVPEKPRHHAGEGRAAGSCLCNGVRFEIETAGARFNHCHCSRCRKARAAAHATNLLIEVSKMRWLAGEDLVEIFPLPGAQRFAQTFCRVCGSKVPRVNQERGYVVVPAGSLDDDPGIRPQRHIFVGSKAPWFEIADSLERHEEAAY